MIEVDEFNGMHVSAEMLAFLLIYCRAHRQPCWVIHTPPESGIGGFSRELTAIEGGMAVTRVANGDVERVPLSQVTVRVM